MEKHYITILSAKEIVYKFKRSLFIGNAAYVKDRSEADCFVDKIKTKYKDATHNVVAYNLFCGGISYCSDDKEPRGTAGRPVLDVLKKENIFDICVVVTRYFGGTLLGTGGLVFSYSNACKEVIKSANLARCVLCELFEVFISYKDIVVLEHMFLEYNVKIVEKNFSSCVTLILAVEKVLAKRFKDCLMEKTNGKAAIKFVKDLWERISM